MGKKEKILLWVFLLTLFSFNLYQVYSSKNKNAEIERLKKTKSIQNNSIVKHQFTEVLLYKKKINFSSPLTYDLQLISIFPENSCIACLLNDSEGLSQLAVKHKSKMHIYYLSQDSVSLKKKHLPKDIGLTTTDKLSEILSGLSENQDSYQLDNPIHLLVNKKGEIISLHLSNLFFPNRSTYFFQKIQSIL
ncbi:MAG: hypothetical protein FH748_03295 [Balneolaceae bacterium]|nr:hypothetical protein [Balneolaceae bacterium]